MESPAAAQLSASAAPRRTGVGAAIGAVAARPRLWPAALRQARAMVPPGWWRRRPFLPLPDRAWLRFRMTTAYGSADAAIDAEDLVVWLAWTDSVRPSPDPVAPRP